MMSDYGSWNQENDPDQHIGPHTQQAVIETGLVNTSIDHLFKYPQRGIPLTRGIARGF
jgi:hypothetical protein